MMPSLAVAAASLAFSRLAIGAPLDAREPNSGYAAVSPDVGRSTGVALQAPITNVQLGPRPYFLVDNMDPGPLKDKLASCSELVMKPTNYSIGHRGGGTLLMPEETRESMVAGPRMGAGVVECDVVFTRDRQLVCRHSQCDLHTTTNIVAVPELNAQCTRPFTPARADGTAAAARCCTSDITLADFKRLCGKMDGFNASAATPADFLAGTPRWRSDLYAACGTLMTHVEYIALVDSMGLQFTPELKAPEVPMPFGGSGRGAGAAPAYTQEAYAQQMIDEYKAAGVDLRRVWPQSFRLDDVRYWLAAEPAMAGQLILLDDGAGGAGGSGAGDPPALYAAAAVRLRTYAAAGVRIVAPPMQFLVAGGGGGGGAAIVPSAYAREARRLGLGLVAWSLERSGLLGDGAAGGYYYATIANVTNNDGDVFGLLHALAEDVGILGVFSDWSATVTYYANCFGHFPTYEDWVKR